MFLVDDSGEAILTIIYKDKEFMMPGISLKFLYSKGLVDFNKDKIKDYFINKRGTKDDNKINT